MNGQAQTAAGSLNQNGVTWVRLASSRGESGVTWGVSGVEWGETGSGEGSWLRGQAEGCGTGRSGDPMIGIRDLISYKSIGLKTLHLLIRLI
jgi:hypothetical protein